MTDCHDWVRCFFAGQFPLKTVLATCAMHKLFYLKKACRAIGFANGEISILGVVDVVGPLRRGFPCPTGGAESLPEPSDRCPEQKILPPLAWAPGRSLATALPLSRLFCTTEPALKRPEAAFSPGRLLCRSGAQSDA